MNQMVEAPKPNAVISTSLVVLHAITAQLERADDGKSRLFNYTMGESWNLDSPIALEFVKKIEEKFRRKNKIHGTFPEATLSDTPSNVKKYIKKQIDFIALTKKLIESLKREANNIEGKSLAGGNIIFIHYKNFGEDEDTGRFLCVMVNKKGEFDFTDKLLPKKVSPIDTDMLRQAASFDLTLLEESLTNDTTDAYLHFIEGKSKSNFFKAALGCEGSIPNKESVTNLFEALKGFSKEFNLNLRLREKIQNAVTAFLEKRRKEKDPHKRQVSLDDVSHIIDKQLPTNTKGIGKFSEYVNDKKYIVNTVFEPTASGVKLATEFRINDENNNFNLTVSQTSIGYSGSNKSVIIEKNLKYARVPLTEDQADMITSTIGKPDED